MAFGMTNPVLNDDRFKDSKDNGGVGWAAPQATATAGGLAGMRPGATTGTGGPVSPSIGDKVMTVGGTIRATAVLWALLLISGAWGWSRVEQVAVDVQTGQRLTGSQTAINEAIAAGTAVDQTQFPGWVFIPVLIAVVLAFVSIFKPRLAPVLSPLYAIGYGIALGAISAMYELAFSGIVLQAVLATVSVFGVMLFLYAARIIKVTRRFAMVVVGATFGILIMYLVGIVASLFGVNLMFYNQPTPLGIGVSVVICVVAALNLALDFAFIENASERRLPAFMNWLGALGITITIVWLYLEMLRLIALIRQ